MAKEILLTKGLVTLVDDEDFPWLNQWKWYAHRTRTGHYAARRDEDTFIYMHRLILGVSHGLTVDHADGNRLNNQRSNLRSATFSENNCNRTKIRRPCGSQYIGVYWNRNARKWAAQIKVAGRQRSLGYFPSEEEAARARDVEAIRHQGPFARLNFGGSCG